MKSEGHKFFDEKGRRLDGRALDELRAIKIECRPLKRADGSAYMEQGRTKLVVAAYGPRKVRLRFQELPDRAFVTCNYSMLPFSTAERKRPIPTRREYEISAVVGNALEAAIFTENYPRAGIDIYVVITNADAGTRCVSISAASVALANAGIALRDIVSSCAVGKVGGKLVLDPCGDEDNYGEADLALAIMPQLNEITLLQMDGQMTKDEFKKALDMALEACRKIYVEQKEALKGRYEQVTKAVGEKE